ERFCALTVRNAEPVDLAHCLIQAEKMLHRPAEMPWPLPLRTEGQIEGRRSGQRFSLSAGQPKTIPVLFRRPERRNEWFMFDEHGNQYFLPASSMDLYVGVYGGKKNTGVTIHIAVGPDWDTSCTIDQGPQSGPPSAPVLAIENSALVYIFNDNRTQLFVTSAPVSPEFTTTSVKVSGDLALINAVNVSSVTDIGSGKMHVAFSERIDPANLNVQVNSASTHV